MSYKNKAVHAAYMREWRKTHKPARPQQAQASCRAYTGMLIKRHQLSPSPCCVCGTMVNLRAHHLDYKNPRLVIWLCLLHHQQTHRLLNARLAGLT